MGPAKARDRAAGRSSRRAQCTSRARTAGAGRSSRADGLGASVNSKRSADEQRHSRRRGNSALRAATSPSPRAHAREDENSRACATRARLRFDLSMAHSRADHCGCFPTGLPYPGIADLLLRAPTVMVGLAEELDSNAAFVDMPLAVIDTETTGKDPARGDRIVEIAIVHFDKGEVTARHALLVDPTIPIPPEAAAVHGITDADVKGKPRWEAVAKQVLDLMRGRVPIAYNAGFDRAFVFSEMRRVGTSPSTDKALPPALRSNVDWIDPLLWARATQPGAKGFKLGEVAERLGIPLVNAHRATDDAEAAGLVLLALLKSEARSYREVVQKQREYAHAERSRGGPFRR